MIFSPDNPSPPKELIDFAERHVRNAIPHDQSERRSERRHFMVVPVLAVPVDEQFRPIGDPTAIVTRDISSHGIGLVHLRPLELGLLALRMQLAGEEVNVVIELAWSKPLGPFELSGGRFVAKLKHLPSADPSQGAADDASRCTSPLKVDRPLGPCGHASVTFSRR
jgi:hypothetical protein